MVQKLRNGSLLKLTWLCNFENMPRLTLTTMIFFVFNIILFIYNSSYILSLEGENWLYLITW